MLRSVNALMGYSILATDGEIGKVDDLLFDDETWGTAYLVVKMRTLLKAKKVLLPPTALGVPDWDGSECFPVAYTKEQVAQSPDIDLDLPVSRQTQLELHKHYGWTPYWIPSAAHGLGALPMVDLTNEEHYPPTPMQAEDIDPHLHSAGDIKHYGIQASDGKIGRVEDLFVDDVTWAVRYLVIDPSAWLPERKVLLAPQLVRTISWFEKKVHVSSTIQMIKDSPIYDPFKVIDQRYQDELARHYRIMKDVA